MTIQTAGQLRGFLADVLLDIRAKRMKPDEAAAIAKVAGEINRSLAVEVATALQAGVEKPVPGSMVITTELPGNSGELPEGAGSDVVFDDGPTEPPKIINQNIPQADPIDPSKLAPIPPKRLEDATANFRRNQDGEKIWCEQCERRVTTGQVVSCKSFYCKAKEVA